MKNPLLTYTLARLGVFAGTFGLLLLINFNPYVAAVLATMLSFAFSLVFLRKPREETSARIYAAVQKPKKTADEAAEDEN
jgi:hypothetical protein